MTKEKNFFEGCAWFKFNNLGLALVMALKFYAIVAKGFKLKVKRFWVLIPAFVEVAGKKLVGSFFEPSPILNRVKSTNQALTSFKYRDQAHSTQ